MSNEVLVPNNFGPLAPAFQNAPQQDDLGAGVQGGFGLIGYKGKVWSLRYRGDEQKLMRPEEPGAPRNSIELVILKASPHIAKIFYEGGYVEGSTAAPDCFSSNGLTPDVSAQKKQSATCAACPKNAWGSRITPGGKQGKACSDSKRLAVAPLDDIRNEAFGGPLLLRVPAASLQDMAGFAQKMHAMGYPYSSIGIRVAFDAQEAYPKFKFSAIRPLTEAEAQVVLELQKSPTIGRILAEGAEHAAASTGPVALPSPFEQPPVAQVAAPVAVAPTPVVAPAPAPMAQPVITAPLAAPVAAPVSGFGPMTPMAVIPEVTGVAPAAPAGSFEDTLDASLEALLPKD
jgi:hypothetical protein